MNNLMRIHSPSGETIHICPSRKCHADPDGIVPIFYSQQHAIDCGWVLTNDGRYCDPKYSTVWVCPDCYVETL